MVVGSMRMIIRGEMAVTVGSLTVTVCMATRVLMCIVMFVIVTIVSWRRGPIAPGNPWRALTLEWQVSSPPPTFNFDEIPQVVGSPYEYGVRGARHAVLNGDRAEAPEREEVRVQ